MIKKKWTNTLSYFRGSCSKPIALPKDLSKELKKCDYIVGQLSGDRKAKTAPTMTPDTYQLCVKSERYLEVFNKNVESIIIFPET